MKAAELTCKTKQEIINFILRETRNYSNQNHNDCNCNHQSINDLEKYITDYVKDLPKEEIKLVETPELPKN
jgi:hypothetical protein